MQPTLAEADRFDVCGRGFVDAVRDRGGDKVGPPCGLSHVFGRCAHSDSSGNHPRSTCTPTHVRRRPREESDWGSLLTGFDDTAGQVVSTPISFRVG